MANFAFKWLLATFVLPVYTVNMEKLAAILLICFTLGACGPREPGQGLAHEEYTPREATAAEQMRMPLTGATRTEQMLYYYNRPEVMEGLQNWQRNWLHRQGAVSPEDPAYREIPRERSPFRQ